MVQSARTAEQLDLVAVSVENGDLAPPEIGLPNCVP